MNDPIYVLAVLCLAIWVSEKIAKKGIGKNLGTALIVILLAAILANFDLIPSSSDSIPLYEGIFQYVAPMSIFFLLLGVNLKEIRRAGAPMLVLFLLGSLATLSGVLISGYVFDIQDRLGPEYDVLAGMFTGTYTGGSINFNAVAIQYEFQENGLLYAGAVAIDNVVTTFWMLMTLLIPGWFKSKKPTAANEDTTPVKLSTGKLSMKSLMILLTLGFSVFYFSIKVEEWSGNWGYEIPSILVLTTFALILAQFPSVKKLKGAELLGLYAVYLFLAVIGAYCDLAAVSELADLGITLILFTFSTVIIHGLIIYLLGGWFFKDWQMISIASQANVGGGTTALALAETFGRRELLLPAILIGSLGNALGTYLGFLTVSIL